MLDLMNPRETILVTTRAEADILGKLVLKDNVMAADWHMPLSFDPQMYCVSIGKSRFTYKLLKKGRVFVINYLDFSKKDKVLFCGRNTGLHIDKFEKAGLEKEEADTIDCPRIKDSLGYIECKVVDEIETGDHVLFVGEVTKAEKRGEGSKVFHVFKDKFTTTR